RSPAAPPAPRNTTITAIPGVVAADVKWTKVWQAPGNSADGILADKDGNALVAQEDYDAVLKIDVNGKSSVLVANAKGVGSLSMDRQGRLYGAHRTERPGSTKADRDSIVNAITVLAPDRKTVASLGVIRTPRGVISVAFAGQNKKTLFAVGSGADDANGQPIREGPQQTAATVYTLPMLSQGLPGRAK